MRLLQGAFDLGTLHATVLGNEKLYQRILLLNQDDDHTANTANETREHGTDKSSLI